MTEMEQRIIDPTPDARFALTTSDRAANLCRCMVEKIASQENAWLRVRG